MSSFDYVIDRKNTNSYKWDLLKYDDRISLGVADMDFKLPQRILDEMHKRIDYGIFGYEYEGDEYYLSFINWMKQRHGLNIAKDWIICVSGVITGIKIAISIFTDIGDCILLQTPIYHAYFEAIDNNNRKVVSSKLVNKDGKYEIDFEDFENVIKRNKVKLFILCNPHNPVGRVWTKDEILNILTICKKYSVVVLSDEVYHDFVFIKEGYNSCISFNNMYDKIIVATSPCKSFNVAGIYVANYVIPNKELREAFFKGKRKSGYIANNALGIKLCESIYKYGGKWLDELVEYIRENIKIVSDYFNEKFPNIMVVRTEASYLLWIDCSCLKINYKELERVFIDEMHIELSQGYTFGDNGKMFIRMNVACPKVILKEALRRIEQKLTKYYNLSKDGGIV